jgi:hypothetical protein
METDQLQNLRKHTEQLALSLMREANPDGVIRTPNPDGTAGPDVPATHHLIEVLARLDAGVFADGISTALQWLTSPENGVSDHPFTLDSLALVASPSRMHEDLLRSGIADLQLKDGSIPVFTAYLPGGDYFSTLWAVKVLSQYSDDVFGPEIARSLEYLTDRREVGCTTASQLGFLGLLLAKTMPRETDILKEIAERTLGVLESQTDQESILLTDRLFILEDLMAIDAVVDGLRPAIDGHLVSLFELSKEAKEIPQPIVEVRAQYSDSLFLETIARCAIVGILRCEMDGQEDLALSVNGLVHSDYRNTRYKALRTSAGLRAFLERYGSIHEAFSGYNDKLERVWETHAFDKTVFLMMPFRPDLKFRKLTQVIKEACQRHGYTAIRVDDAERRFSDRLWDNLIINMLASKYAVAVYVSEPVVDRLKKDEVRFFANPNVALEFGFFKSRGQDVLLLKDKASDLPSDLQGFLWSEFDIENPDTTVPQQIEAWLERIKEATDTEGS